MVTTLPCPFLTAGRSLIAWLQLPTMTLMMALRCLTLSFVRHLAIRYLPRDAEANSAISLAVFRRCVISSQEGVCISLIAHLSVLRCSIECVTRYAVAYVVHRHRANDLMIRSLYSESGSILLRLATSSQLFGDDMSSYSISLLVSRWPILFWYVPMK
jgi:hypothetical protein